MHGFLSYNFVTFLKVTVTVLLKASWKMFEISFDLSSMENLPALILSIQTVKVKIQVLVYISEAFRVSADNL